MSAPGSTAIKVRSDPPRLSTFKRRGGVLTSHVQLSDGQDRSTQINAQSCSPAPLSCPVFNPCGPSSHHFTHPLPAIPCCHVTLICSSSLVRVASLSVHHPLIACHASPSFHISSRLKVVPFLLNALLHGPSSVTPLCYHSHSSPLLSCAPQCHYTYHAPCPPRWPSCPSLKISSYSRWQREKSSESRSAELAGPLSIPRSSY
jgi:hypothetical protein